MTYPCYPLTVIDLDGTYVRGNTLHIYIRCGMQRMIARRRYLKWLYASALLCLRALRLIGHKTMKFGICRMIDSADPELRDRFVGCVRPLINPTVAAAAKDSRVCMLATAAPDVYVPWIWDGMFVATPIKNNPKRRECRGEAKLADVQSYINKEILCNFDTLYTDHTDDLPLMRAFVHTVLVNPSAETVKQVAKQGIVAKIIE